LCAQETMNDLNSNQEEIKLNPQKEKTQTGNPGFLSPNMTERSSVPSLYADGSFCAITKRDLHMSNNGFFSLPRSLTRNPLWLDLPPAYKQVFLVIVDYALFGGPQTFDDHGQLIELQPGQICISERGLMDLCGNGISKNDIHRSLVKFKLYGFLNQQVNHRKNIITITHTDTYDLIKKSSEPISEPKLNQSRTKLEPQNKKEQITKNKQEGIAQTAAPLRKTDIFFSFDSKSFENIQPDDLKAWKEICPALEIELVIKEMTQWCLSNPAKTKSKKLWRKFILGWLRSENEKAINKQAYASRVPLNTPTTSASTYAKSLEDNRKFAEKIKSEFHSSGCEIIIDSEGLAIIHGGQGGPWTIKFKENDFMDRFKRELNNRNFKKRA